MTIINMMKYFLRTVAILFFILGFIASGVLGWFFYVAALRPALDQKWIQIPSPVEQLISLSVDDAGEVFAEGEDGGLYQLSFYPEPAWIGLGETETVYSGLRCRPITDNLHKRKSMSNEVKAQVSVDCSFAEQAVYLDINLLENGETWYFETSSNAYVQLGLFVILPVGLVINAALYAIGLFFLALDWFIAKRRKAKQAAA